MLCPFCNTENRDDIDACYNCNKDLSMLRLIVNKAKHHYNVALEHAERGRYYEAITELQNALDLDNKSVNARVVLGTIYAKQNHFEQAVEQWDKALAIDQRFQKAHEYILKAGQVKDVLPLIKWLKILSGGLIIAILSIITLVLIFNKPDKRILYLKRAYKDFQEEKITDASQSLKKIETKKPDEVVTISKDLLDKAIKNEVTIAKSQVLIAIKDDLPYEAVKILDNLRNKKPDAETLSWISTMEKSIVQSLVTQIQRNLENFENQGDNPTEITYAIEQFRTTFPDQPEGIKFSARLNNAIKNSFEKELKSIYKNYQEEKNVEKADAGLKNLSEKYNQLPEFPNAINETLKKIHSEEISIILSNCQDLIKQSNLDQAESLITKAKSLGNIPKESLEKILELNSKIQSRRAEVLINSIVAASKNKDYEQVIELAKNIDFNKIIEQDKKTVEKELNSARRNLAIKRYQWLLSLDSKFEESRQSVEDSKKTVEYFQVIMENLPPKTFSYAFDEVIFYTGSAYYKLGEVNKGDEFFDRLKKEYPQSPYIKSIEKIKKKVSKTIQ